MMDVEEFKKLDWMKQNDVLEPYVLATLQSLRGPVTTKKVMLDVAARYGWLDSRMEYLPGAAKTVGNVLKRFARHKKGWATHDGETFKFAGKEVVRWTWWPQPKDKNSTLDELMG